MGVAKSTQRCDRKRARRMVKVPIPEWWPPKVGDRVRWHDYEEYLAHVVAVFNHDGRTLVTIAYYGKHKRWWFYEVVRSIDAYYCKIWPDGQPRPKATSDVVCRR